MPRRVVAEALDAREIRRRDLRRVRLDLLEAEHVGLLALEKFEESLLQHGANAVDVPRNDARQSPVPSVSLAAMRAGGQPFALIGQVHRDLPFMYGDALVAADTFDFLLDDPGTPLFCPPNLPVLPVEHALSLNVSTLVRDGGTLQLGIGELGDGIVYALQLRHQQPATYREVLESTGVLERHRRLIETEGGTAPDSESNT